MIDVAPTALPEVKLLVAPRHFDARGFFSETYSKRALAAVGIDHDFVQDNVSLTPARGVLRGLHFQTAPHAQAKLIRVTRGAIWDVAVDIRHDSPRFGRWNGTLLSAEDWNQLYVPEGFAHGFLTLAAGTEVQYKVSAYYNPASEAGLAWNDPELAIAWPIPVDETLLSAKDRDQPRLAALPPCFRYDGGADRRRRA